MDAWTRLKDFTAARVALGRAGGSVPTAALLDFRMSHARARDAVLTAFDAGELAALIRPLHGEVLTLESRAVNRDEYLRRPDLGRRLSDDSLRELAAARPAGASDIVIVVSDGLSTLAAMRQIPLLLQELLPLFRGDGWSLAPVVVARHGRVAIQDEIGETLGAGLSLMLLGERPGLGSHDSLGAYFTYQPRVGRTDADRNCISNIRAEGLRPQAAAHKIFHLMREARRLRLSGFQLKDETQMGGIEGTTERIG